MVGSGHGTLNNFHKQGIIFSAALAFTGCTVLESNPVQEAHGADHNCDNRGSVSTGLVCSLGGDDEFYLLYGTGGPEKDVWSLICSGS